VGVFVGSGGFVIHIPKLLISGVKTPKALLAREISASRMEIQNAKIEIQLGHSQKNSEKDFNRNITEELSRQLLRNLKSIEADTVILDNAVLILKNKADKTVRVLAEGLNILFSGIAIDNLKQNDSSRILFSKDLVIQCDYLDIPFKNKVYELQIHGLIFESKNRHFHSDKIKLNPLLSETAFARSNKYAKDRLDITAASLDIWQINRKSMLNRELIADSIAIKDASIKIFRDKSYPHDSIDRTHDFPQEALMRMTTPVYLTKIILRDSYIEYKEKNDKSDSSGKVAFFHVDATLDNVTNIMARIQNDNEMRLAFHASFLNKADFLANIRMRLHDNKGNFYLAAKMNEIDGISLNPLLKPMALAELDKGKIYSMQYQMKATNTKATGKLMLHYKGISIRMLKKDDNKNKYKTKFLPTLAAKILLKDSNPQNGKTRIGIVEYNRDIHRSVFNLMWKSLFSGIKQDAY
jgi:hypothetical protein